jgi:hypothetical protein
VVPGSGIISLPGEALTKPNGLLVPEDVDSDKMAIGIEEKFARDKILLTVAIA